MASLPYTATMLELSRTVRMCVNEGTPIGGNVEPAATARSNTFAAWPAMRGLGRYYEFVVTCRGEADPVTGYFINIKHIDTAVREEVLGHLESVLAEPGNDPAAVSMGDLMQDLIDRLQPALDHSVVSLRLSLTPYFSIEIRSDTMDHVTVRQQFEFSAAHRLHVPNMSDEENQAIFGKCNNPAGHGHNYRLEVAVRCPIAPNGQAITCEEFDEVVDREAIQTLDHKHLNTDVPEFAELNPSVENIAKVIWEMLAKPVQHMGAMEGAELEEIRVWETGKTVCSYRGD